MLSCSMDNPMTGLTLEEISLSAADNVQHDTRS